MRVAIVHDDLVQWGGAERVLLAISDIFPDAPIYTSLFDEQNSVLIERFGSKKIVTSFMNRIPGWKSLYKALLPFYPIAFESFDFSNFDLVISHTTRFAKSVITKPGTKHICFCATPPRFLWNFSKEKPNKFLLPIFNLLRIQDWVSSKRVDLWIAGSKNAQSRINKIYKVDSIVLQPFVDDIFFQFDKNFDGGYYLIISRLIGYKRLDLVVKVFNELNKYVKIVGKGPMLNKLQRDSKDTIDFLNESTEENLVKLLAGCKALIVAAEEDFGLTPLEAQAMGKPVIAFGHGGVLETVIPNKTGIFFFDQNKNSLKEAIIECEKRSFDQKACILNAKKFTKKKFQERFFNLVQSFKLS